MAPASSKRRGMCEQTSPWSVTPDGAHHVLVQRVEGQMARLPVPLATRLWVATGCGGGTGDAVLFSVAAPSTPLSLNVAFAPCHPDGPVPWPAWDPSPPPAWQPCPVGRWFGLPDPSDTRDVAELLRRSNRDRLAEEQCVDRGIQDRCDAIRSHGSDDGFLDSLEYYTTLRVKHAYLRMNASSLRERLTMVGNTVEALRLSLSRAPAAMHTGWRPPPSTASSSSAHVDDSEGLHDPNVPGVPLLQDYYGIDDGADRLDPGPATAGA